MSPGKRRQLLLRTAKTFAALSEGHSAGKIDDSTLAYAERCLEQAALIWVGGLSPEDKARIAQTD